jgi:uncharacterized protein YkwD
MRRPLLALALATQLTPAFAEPQAPPPALLIDGVGESGVDHPRVTRSAEGSPVYSVGEPTDDEQLYLELINRTRADPLAEALRLANLTDPDVRNAYEFFKVDLQKFVNDTAGYPVAQPLAFELRLIEAARGHSSWMLTHGLQDHDQTNPPGSGNVSATLTDRLAAVGYPFSTAGESIYAFAKDPEHGHAGPGSTGRDQAGSSEQQRQRQAEARRYAGGQLFRERFEQSENHAGWRRHRGTREDADPVDLLRLGE